jgi:hypothetical protein
VGVSESISTRHRWNPLRDNDVAAMSCQARVVLGEWANDDPLPELQPDFVDAVSAQSPSAIGPKAERGQAGIFLAVHLQHVSN